MESGLLMLSASVLRTLGLRGGVSHRTLYSQLKIVGLRCKTKVPVYVSEVSFLTSTVGSLKVPRCNADWCELDDPRDRLAPFSGASLFLYLASKTDGRVVDRFGGTSLQESLQNIRFG
jgi:hypothetical protein